MAKRVSTPSAPSAVAVRPPKSRYRGGVHAIGKVVDRITAPARRKRGLTVGELLTDWPRIVGSDIARVSSPARFTPGPRATVDGDAAGAGRPGGDLLIRVGGPMALQLQHMAPTLIDRINGYFGYRAVSRISFLQAPSDEFTRRHRRAVDRVSPTTPDAAPDVRLEPLSPGPLKDALGRLGGRLSARQEARREVPDGPLATGGKR